MKEKQVKFRCSSCGAEIDSTMARCPYCDTLIPEGAEAEYMKKLYAIRGEMEELNEVPEENLKTELKHQGRRIKKILLAGVLLLMALFGMIFLQERQYERDNTADYIWGQQNFPQMNELFENGDYEELEEIVLKALEEDRPLWNWEYYEDFWDIMEERE